MMKIAAILIHIAMHMYRNLEPAGRVESQLSSFPSAMVKLPPGQCGMCY